MSFEKPTFEPNKEAEPQVKIEVESGCEQFVPEDFKQNPLGYFESQGKNIKSGQIKRDETGRVREDPTAVKELPIWSDSEGNQLNAIGKRVNIEKGKVGESGDPFYEYRIMETVRDAGLPTPRPIAKVEQSGAHLIVMEKVQGIGWYEKDALHLKEKGYTDEDIEALKRQAEEQMLALQARFEEAGIERGWKLKDMIFDIDIESKTIRGITPVDWERTKINKEKLEAYKKSKT
jgi:hypothetical protein